MAFCSWLSGWIAPQQGDLAAAHALQEESMTQAQAFDDLWEIAFCLEGLAETVAAQGEATRAGTSLGGSGVSSEQMR